MSFRSLRLYAHNSGINYQILIIKTNVVSHCLHFDFARLDFRYPTYLHSDICVCGATSKQEGGSQMDDHDIGR